MKKTLTLFFVFLTVLTYSQNKNSTAIYNYSFHFDDAFYGQLDATKKYNFKEAERVAKSLQPILVFNDSLAVFFSDDIMDIENKMALIIAKAFCKCNTPLYYNIDEKMIYNEIESNFAMECNDCLLFDTMKTNWKLHTESKLITNYLCYKATQSITHKVDEKEFTNLITAWYCPEIPYSIGPRGYGGLPGLIFELHEKEGSYGIINLTLNTNTKKIEFPQGKKLISYEDY